MSNNLDMKEKTTHYPSWMPESPLVEELYSSEIKEQFQKNYHTSSPYKHLRIDRLCEESSMLKVRTEILNSLPTFHRETDLFKVAQTIDFNNISLDSDLAKEIPTLMALRESIYSDRFRSFLEETLDCGKLSERVDMAANQYQQGLQLACHDDGVQVTRKLSFIIYASQTDMRECPSELNKQPWSEELGGYLELYQGIDVPIFPKNLPQSSSAVNMKKDNIVNVCVPIQFPSKCIAPEFNTMVIFEVKPGESFHAVQEVYGIHSNRISIQGWFHAAQPNTRDVHHQPTVRLLQSAVVHPDVGTALQQIEACEDVIDEMSQIEPVAPHLGNLLLEEVVVPKSAIDSIMTDSSIRTLNQSEISTIVQSMFYADNTTPSPFSDNSLNIVNKIPCASNLVHHALEAYFKSVDEDESAMDDASSPADDVRSHLKFLRYYINPSYTMVKTLESLRTQFQETGVLSLRDFLNPKLCEVISKLAIALDVEEGFALIPNWERQREAVAEGNADEDEDGCGDEDEDVEYVEVDEDEDEDIEYEYVYEDEDENDGGECVFFHPKPFVPQYLTSVTVASTSEDPQLGAWVMTGPCYKQRSLMFHLPSRAASPRSVTPSASIELVNSMDSAQRLGLVLTALSQQLLQSTAFQTLLQWLTDYHCLAQVTHVRRMRCGLDYTVGCYDHLTRQHNDKLSVALTFVDEGQYDRSQNIWANSQDKVARGNYDVYLYPDSNLDTVDDSVADSVDEDEDEEVGAGSVDPLTSTRIRSKRNWWKSDDCGGFHSFVSVDKSTEGDDAEAYVEEADDNVVSLSATNNTLTIVNKSCETLEFVRYISCYAPGSRVDVVMNVDVEKPEDNNP